MLGAGLLCGTCPVNHHPRGGGVVQDSWKGEPSIFPVLFIHFPIQGDEYAQSSTLLQCLCYVYSKVSYQLKTHCWWPHIEQTNDWLCYQIMFLLPPHVDWYCSAMGENQNISESNSTTSSNLKERPASSVLHRSLVSSWALCLMFVVDQIPTTAPCTVPQTLLLIRNTISERIHSRLPDRGCVRIVMYNRHSFFQTVLFRVLNCPGFVFVFSLQTHTLYACVFALLDHSL